MMKWLINEICPASSRMRRLVRYNLKTARKAARCLMEGSASFTFEPYPDGVYVIYFKAEQQTLLLSCLREKQH